MVIAPTVLLLLWAHILRATWPASNLFACTTAGLSGLAVITVGPWREPVKVAIAGIYMLVALIALPMMWLEVLLAINHP